MTADNPRSLSAPEAIPSWWRRAPLPFARSEHTASPLRWYRFGDGFLGLSSSDGGFARRFHDLFEECEAEAPGGGAVAVECRVGPSATPGAVQAEVVGAPDLREFLPAMFADRGLVALERDGPWHIVGDPAVPEEAAAVGAAALVLPARGAWQRLLGSLLVCCVQARQPGVLFLHAGAVALRGAGVLLVGPKESGKTTLALGLAARGHRLLGDELAAVRRASLELLPVRRSCAIREGPRHRLVDAALGSAPRVTERFPDGSLRWRAAPRRLFPAEEGSGPVPLRCVLFLEGRAPEPRLEARPPSRALLGQLTPLQGSVWCRSAGALALDLLAVVGGAECASLQSGSPEDTVALIETFVEQQWT